MGYKITFDHPIFSHIFHFISQNKAFAFDGILKISNPMR